MSDNVIPFPSAAPGPEELLSEERILELRACLSAARLRAARKAGTITWTTGKRKSPWYRLTDVDLFIRQTLERKCRDLALPPSLNSGITGSQESQGNPTSTAIGLTPELAEHAADRLAAMI
jgi:hypothetical protein